MGDDEGKLVYSSGASLTKNKQGRKSKDKNTTKKREPGTGPLKINLERKGRGGKCVSLVTDLSFDDQQAKEYATELAQSFGCGARFKKDTIVVQGDKRSELESFFKAKGLAVRKS